jgi:hypothetical protein
MDTSKQGPQSPAASAVESSVEANARLTVNSGMVLLVLFPIEVVTVVIGARRVLTLHVVVGLLLVPPLLVKIASVSWRFLQYYRAEPRYRGKGAPTPALRLLGPLLVTATVGVMTSGIVLLMDPLSFGGNLRRIHSITFDLWLILVVAHVALHWRGLRSLASADLVRRSRNAVSGAVMRQTVVLTSLAVGLVLALSLVSQVQTYRDKVGN